MWAEDDYDPASGAERGDRGMAAKKKAAKKTAKKAAKKR
jgi:hypothetical protein